MKNKNMKKLYLIISFVLVLLVTACNTKADDEPEEDSSLFIAQDIELDESIESEDVSDTQSILLQEEVTAITDEPQVSAEKKITEPVVPIEPVATKEISIYTLNETTLEVEVVEALVPEESEITPDLIVDMVVDSLADRLVMVGIDEVTTKDDTVIVSFLSDVAPSANVGSGPEGTILDCLAQSLVDNLVNYPDYPKVIFRLEGQAYASGHFEFGINEVYLDGNRTK